MTRCRFCNGDDGPCSAHDGTDDGFNQRERDDWAEDRDTRSRDAMS